METVLCWLHHFWVKRDERKQLRTTPDPAKMVSLQSCDHPFLDEETFATDNPAPFLSILHQSTAQAPRQLMDYAGFPWWRHKWRQRSHQFS
jgi:hypothetical protein